MPNPATVRNTDHATVDHDNAASALAQLVVASSLLEISDGLDMVAEALGLPHYVMLHMSGPDLCVHHVVHNVAADIDLDAVAGHAFVGGLLSRPIPALLDGQIELLELQTGLGVAVPHGGTLCVLLLGAGRAGVDPAQISVQMGMACMAAGHLADALRRLTSLGCPLTARELQCLRAAAGRISAKETARELGISPRTVEEYVVRCRKRLGVDTTLEAVIQAMRNGWINAEDIEEPELSSRRRRYGGR